MKPPLENIRVLDLTRLLPGGICTLMLADQGAEVIKVEQPGMGDYARWYVPRVGDYAAVFHALNRNKHSLALDLKHPEGQAVLHRLAKSADVLIDSFRPNVSKRLSIDYNVLRPINPRLIVCSLSGFGQTGPLADTAAHDLNFAGLTGVLSAGATEQVLPIQAMDYGGAYLAAFAIMTALFQRVNTGEGAFIDAALLDSGLSLMTIARAEAFARNTPPRPGGETLTGGYACYRVYRTADDQPISLAALEPKFWEAFCLLAGRADLARQNYLDPDIQPWLIAEISETFRGKTHAEWMDILADSETCAAPLLDLMQAAQHPQIQAREALFMADGVAHTYTPFRAGERIAYRPAPALGEDTEALLEGAGYSPAEIAALRENGVIG